MGPPMSSVNFLSTLTFSMMDTKYNRDNELQSDYQGMIRAVEAGYELEGGVCLQEELDRASKSTPAIFKLTPVLPGRHQVIKEII